MSTHAVLLITFISLFPNSIHGYSMPKLDSKHVDDISHLKQHLDNSTHADHLSIQEVRFNYFRYHDYDGDNRLDGQEIIKAVLHFQEDESAASYVFSDEELVMFLDPIMQRDDSNVDGFLDYSEFMSYRTTNN